LYSFLTGGIGQAADLLTLGHILTRIATQQQANPQFTFMQSIKSIHSKGGIPEFYKGLRWNLLIGVMKGASRWGLNNSLYRFYTTNFGNSSLVPVMVGVTGAAIETTLILCPFESLRTREMTTFWKEGKVNMWHTITKIDGVKIFFRGWDSILLRQVVTWVTYLVVYDQCRNIALKSKGSMPLTWIDKILVGSATGFVACLLNTPFDMFKTQVQKDQPLKLQITSLARVLYSQYGAYGLYSSLGTRALRSTWYSAVTLLTMDYLNALPSRMKL